MPSPSIVIIWVLGTELASPGVSEVGRAARQALGPRTEVRVSAVESVAGSQASVPTSTVGLVRLTWDTKTSAPAHLSCYLPRFQRWVDRDVAFEADDPEVERGRAIGFVLSSILLEQGAIEPELERLPESTVHRVSKAPMREQPPRTALGAGIEGSGPGTATGFGPYVGLQRALLTPTLWVGGAVHARFGSIPEAQASTLVLAAGPEFAWLPWRPTASTWLGLRGSVFVSYLSVSHLSDDDIVADVQARWLPGTELSLHGGLELARSAAVFSDVGVTMLAGETELEVRHRIAAVWPWATGLLRVGIQGRF